MDPGLSRLCRAQGIITSLRDRGGGRHAIDTDGAVALLSAMGIRADSPAAVREALQQGQARQWRRTLQPVRVLRAGEPIELVLSWPMAQRGQRSPGCWKRRPGRCTRAA